ncbi:SLC13 family permease [Nitrosospira multiformis]|uniref:Solute carrier family 13 (Sodium-dependent dicarboxylate transporter), member 2/3/5 n=1 Tax=Nitrosospira multiformis TaxID=1231 RepID=A0A1I7H4P1_9PROT|nr:SLC13 family permease [Nitrosospira multiformis]SFU55658.1 solute carrier family 13 (sodium-dependent dicarboxylate transporter), member 2/3/5 [Nitrosospira multiformis]
MLTLINSSPRHWALFAGPLLAAALALAMSSYGWDAKACWTGAISVLCVVWWIFEPIPIPATSIIPLAVFPLVGVMPQEKIAAAYGSDLILLMLGGFMISAAMARSGSHRRLALTLVNVIGGHSSRRIVLGFMCACAVVSMWISNTATAVMMLPIALAVIDESQDKNLAAPLLLAIAYGCSIGGLGTPIGTPPNLVFMQQYRIFTGNTVSFTEWMSWGLPTVLLLVPLAGFWLTRNLNYFGELVMPPPGPWRPEERRVMIVFGITILAWLTRIEPFGGWSTWFGFAEANDAVVALIAVVAMFLVPNGRGSRLLDWESAEKVPWGTLILFAAGITIAQAFVESGLSRFVAQQLAVLSGLHPLVIIAAIALAVTFLTETTSNTATTVLLMPLLAPAAIVAGIDPGLLMVPAAMSASCAFMLPVGTPPNAIVFGTGRIPITYMAREGLVLNLIGAVIITLVCYFLVA